MLQNSARLNFSKPQQQVAKEALPLNNSFEIFVNKAIFTSIAESRYNAPAYNENSDITNSFLVLA